MTEQNQQDVKTAVIERYRKVAEGAPPKARGLDMAGCCSSCQPSSSDEEARAIGYSKEELAGVPEGSNMGLGCGNPQAIASLKAGEVVLDLGSGGGFDCFLAAAQVGPKGQVIGVDMTPEMVAKARANAARTEYDNVSFRLGEIEYLPVADSSVDVIISNCVINLAPDKAPVYREAFRVLKRGGRLAISDVVATGAMPEKIRQDLSLWSCCVSGASHVDEVRRLLEEAGFVEIRITTNEASREVIKEWTSQQGSGAIYRFGRC